MAVKRQIVWGVASLATLYIGVANALGLGELKLDSALNQPLNATIFLQGGDDIDPSDIRVSLADAAAFRNAGLERPHFLTELRFTPTMENNQLVVRVQSPGPVREPYLNFLVELRRPNGRLLREYTLLLDPPMYQPPSAPQPRTFPAPASNAVQQGRSVDTAPRSSAPSDPAAPPAALPDLSPAAGAQQYRTASGDSLWSIASRARPGESVSIEETMLAIRALNPDAFINGDPSRLRVGQLLTLPTAQQLGASGSTSSAETTPDIAQAEERNAASLIPPRPASNTASSSAAELQTGSASAGDRRSAGPDSSGEPTARLRIEEEQRSEQVSADAALLADRLRSLEARFNVMLDELDARDRQIASLQAELDILRQAQQAEDDRSDTDSSAAAGPTLSDAQDSDGAVSTAGSDEPQPGAVDAEVLPAVADTPEPAQPIADESQAGAAQEPAEQGFILRWWPALLALLAVLLGLVFFARKRTDDQDDSDVEDQVMPAQPTRVAPEAAAPLAAAMAADTATQRPATVRAAPKPVDPLDGVELYITYGRFAEARAMLDKAIADQPNRLDLRYKQLRVLAELGESRAFTAQEEQVLAQGGDAGRIEQIKARFPALFAGTEAGLVEQVDHVEPMLPDETTPGDDEQVDSERAEDITATQLNLNDFTLDPDWDLIEGLTPTAPRKDSESTFGAADERFESSLHEFPEIEELDDEHNEHFPGLRKNDKPRSDDR